MTYTPKNIQGIEGDDIAYHLQLLGQDIANLPKDIYFYPLNDHYNTHQSGWKETADRLAADARAVVFYDLVNTGDYEHSVFCNFVTEYSHPNKFYLTVNQSPNLKVDDVTVMRWDFMWNRFKAYYTEQIPESLFLHHYAYQQYQLPELDFINERTKLFMSLTGREFAWRTKLYEEVSKYDGYISNRSKGIYLESEPVAGAFSPVPNTFYMDSYISIFVESNCTQSNLVHLTEKTFDPLVKGHIILPFANPGSLRRVRDLGFQLAPFVDYSYDSIIDPMERFDALLVQFRRLLNMDIAKLYNDYQDIFLHNQRCINGIPYDHNLLKIFNV